jgi:hypothetical protein
MEKEGRRPWHLTQLDALLVQMKVDKNEQCKLIYNTSLAGARFLNQLGSAQPSPTIAHGD